MGFADSFSAKIDKLICLHNGCHSQARASVQIEEHVMVDESIREDERSDDEKEDENIKGGVCQLLDQRTASQRRDKSCAPSH